MARSAVRRAAVTQNAVVSRAALRAAARLGLSNKVLGRIIGLSEATISRMGSGSYTLSPGDKAFDLAVLFIRLFRALDAIAGGDGDGVEGTKEPDEENCEIERLVAG